MRVKIEFYGPLRELAGQHEWSPDVPPGTTVGEALDLARRAFPGLADYPARLLFTAGFDYVEPTHVIRAGEKISILPAPSA